MRYPENPAVPSVEDWFAAHHLENLTPIAKETQETRAWFASMGGQDLFLKLYQMALPESRAEVEIAISGGRLHPAIVPLRKTVLCREGTLLLYDRVQGENLGPTAARGRFQALPLSERMAAVCAVMEALAAIGDAGFMDRGLVRREHDLRF